MKQNFTESAPPTIVRIVSARNNGIEVFNLSRYAICYILRGCANIYCGDQRTTLSRGDVVSLGLGNHYIEKMPEPETDLDREPTNPQFTDVMKIAFIAALCLPAVVVVLIAFYRPESKRTPRHARKQE